VARRLHPALRRLLPARLVAVQLPAARPQVVVQLPAARPQVVVQLPEAQPQRPGLQVLR